jgi:hypothetical protein
MLEVGCSSPPIQASPSIPLVSSLRDPSKEGMGREKEPTLLCVHVLFYIAYSAPYAVKMHFSSQLRVWQGEMKE